MRHILAVCLMLLVLPALSGCGKNTGVMESRRDQVIRIAGSTSMMPISEKLARAYEERHPGVKIYIEGGDSTLGVTGASRNMLDIGSASRPLTAAESSGLTSYRIAEDSISVIVNEKNPVRGLTIRQAREIFSGGITNWGQVGGESRPITLVNREQGSGTYRVFEDLVMGGKAGVTKNALVMPSNGAVASTVTRDANSIGYISSYYQAGGVRSLEIHTGENKVFVLGRPLFYVIPAGASGLVRDYIAFCTGWDGRKIVASHLEH